MKYISQLYLEKNKKEFIELKQGEIMVVEYEWEFVRRSKYARELGLSEDIRMLVEALELKEFIVLFEKAQEIEDIRNQKK
ncbi:Gag-Pol polyprotein [Gossypium australe]|uniref:Gag-Pol polyprotein n=1 Tax=Gossypium australe TaxID=47621 RepID=A0A5B6VVJ2_9ROSI|nr:Gag-Pol polyprotein [Gossypium australe]